MDRLSLGKKGELMAQKFLRQKGLKIIATNFYTPRGELDIIAQEKDELVFVEVKTRTSELFGKPEEAVDKRKQEKLQKLAEFFLAQHSRQNSPIRFDVVVVKLDPTLKTREKIEWFRQVI